MKKVRRVTLALLALFAFLALESAMAEEQTVIMNIPYTEFYQAELNLPADYEVDTVTSATEKVYKNAALVGGSYAVEGKEGTHEILGVSFPVKAEEGLLAAFTQVADAEALSSSASYSYYIPQTAPAYYKPLTGDAEHPVFGAVENLETISSDATVVLDEVKGRRGDYKLEIKGFDFATDGSENIVYGAVVKTADAAYPLRHLENIFGGNELAINAGSSKLIKGVNPAKPENYTALEGATITEVDYYTSKGKYVFAADVTLPDQLDNRGYVLMNIPYQDFYAAEVTDASSLDAVTSSTLNKPRTGTLAGGSYHVDPAGSDITGVIYPVYVEDMQALATLGGVEITDDTQVEITVTNKGQETTTTYAGKDALFEAPSYSWYVMKEGSLPKQYKKLTMDPVSFSGINKKDKTLDAQAALVWDKHADIVIKVTGADEKLGDSDVSAVVLVADDGTKVGLRHIRNIWRRTQLGIRLDSEEYSQLKGKNITQIRFITQSANYVISTDIPVSEDERLVALTGSYVELFPEFAREDLKPFWMETLAQAGVQDDMAEMYYVMLTQTYMGRLVGQEAIDAYADPANMLFDCYFENGLAKLSVQGNVISGVDSEGNELFRHTYSYVGDEQVTFFGEAREDTVLHVYATEDADAGDYAFFAFSDDNTAQTQHVELRYGPSRENIADYTEGDYAYWLASGIVDGYKDSLIQECIRLFVTENVGEVE